MFSVLFAVVLGLREQNAYHPMSSVGIADTASAESGMRAAYSSDDNDYGEQHQHSLWVTLIGGRRSYAGRYSLYK